MSITRFSSPNHFSIEPLGIIFIHTMSSYDLKQYFVPGYLISKHIMFSHIQIYLGPYATVRPYSYRGRDGYLVSAPGQPLTRVSSFKHFLVMSIGLILPCTAFSLLRNGSTDGICAPATLSLQKEPGKPLNATIYALFSLRF